MKTNLTNIRRQGGIIFLALMILTVSSCSQSGGGGGYGTPGANGNQAQMNANKNAAANTSSPRATELEQKARAHWKEISAENLEAVMGDYAAAPALDWVGGPLNGKYDGADAVRATWTKLFAGQEMKDAEPSNVRVNGDELTADVIFKTAAGAIPVRYTLDYDAAGKIAKEQWRIDPTLAPQKQSSGY